MLSIGNSKAMTEGSSVIGTHANVVGISVDQILPYDMITECMGVYG